MGDGPPWIQYAAIESFTIGDLIKQFTGFHVRLDERKPWLIECIPDRPSGNKNELTVGWYKPHYVFPTNTQQELFLQWNDLYPTLAGPYHNYKFDNEDMYLLAYSKPQPGQAANWTIENPIDVALDSSSNKEWVHLKFSNGTSTITVKITREGRRGSKKRSVSRPRKSTAPKRG